MNKRTMLTVFLLLGAVCVGQAAEPTAQQILDSVSGATAFSSSGQAEIEMVVTNKRGQSKTQQVELYRSDDGKDTTKQLVIFKAPADVKGTKFLSINTPDQGSQMWLYLPAIGRERVIAGSAVQGKFMGTDFTFEEISGDISFSDDYTPVRKGDKKTEGRDCYVLELTPKSSKATYGKLVMAIDKESRLPLSVQFYDKRNRQIKELTSKDLRRNNKGEWQPHEVLLADLNSGGNTRLRILSTNDQAVSEEMFTLRYLRR